MLIRCYRRGVVAVDRRSGAGSRPCRPASAKDFATELPTGIYRHGRPGEASTPMSQGVRPPRHSRAGVVSAVTSGLMGVVGGAAARPVKVGRTLISAGAAGVPKAAGPETSANARSSGPPGRRDLGHAEIVIRLQGSDNSAPLGPRAAPAGAAAKDPSTRFRPPRLRRVTVGQANFIASVELSSASIAVYVCQPNAVCSS